MAAASVLVFGEVLWDIYPDESFIGGAPFNFAAHAARQGARVELVSAVGRDELAAPTLAAIDRFGVGREYVTVSTLPTGRCTVGVDGRGIPSYDLSAPGAYDDISAPDSLPRFDALYFGTLAQRAEASRLSLAAIIARGGFGQVFYDVNIRGSYYSAQVLRAGLEACTVLKFSREEAGVFAALGLCPQGLAPGALCAHLSERFSIPTVLMTMDCDGAVAWRADTASAISLPARRVRVASTVGAGDSFSAAYLCAMLRGAAPEECLRAAIDLSARVVACMAAVPDEV